MKHPTLTRWLAIGSAVILNSAFVTASFGTQPGLQLWMNFDDGTPTDRSGNDLNGTLMGGAEIVDDAERGMVLSLNGSTAHVPIPDPAGLLNFSDGRSATVAAWVHPNVTKNHNQIFAQGEWNDGASIALKGDTSPANQLWTQGQGGGTAQRSNVGLLPGQWAHVAAVFSHDPGANTLNVSFYINGELTGHAEGGAPLSGGINAPAGGGNTIGREQRGADTTARWFFNGLIDDLQVYDVALDQSGILIAMQGFSAEVEMPIVADFGSVRFVNRLNFLTDGEWSGPTSINQDDTVYLGETDTITSLPAPLAGKLAFQTENEIIISDPLNRSFEEPILGATGGEAFTSFWSAANNEALLPGGWRIYFTAGQPGSPSVGVQNPATGHFGQVNPLPEPFDGNQVAFVNLNNDGETVAVADSDIMGSIQAGQTYVLNVAVGARNAAAWREIHYAVGLVAADGTELGEFATVQLAPGSSPTNIADLEYTLDVNAEAAASVGQNFFVRIRAMNTGEGGTGGFTQATFDNIRLSPDPGQDLDIQITAAGPLGFVVDRDTTVYIAFDENMTVPAWITTRYNNTGMSIETTAGNFDVWSRDVQARDYVALPGSARSLPDENNHWVILSHGPEAITTSADGRFTRMAPAPGNWTLGAHHWRLTASAAAAKHTATMLANIGNIDPERGFKLNSTIRVPRLQDDGDNAIGFVLLGLEADSESPAGIRAEWLPRATGGNSTLRLVDASNGSLLNGAEVVWEGITPTATDNDVGVGTGATEVVLGISSAPFTDVAGAPLTENFADGGTGWTTGSHNANPTEWEIGIPTSGPGSAYVGQNVAATNLSGGYGASTESWLRSPIVDLTDANEATLRYHEYLHVDTYVEAGSVFHYTTVSVLDADTLEATEIASYSQHILNWTPRELDLSDFAGQRIILEFGLTSDAVLNEDWQGWYLDNIQVTGDGAVILSMPSSIAPDGTLNGIATENSALGNTSASYLEFIVADRGTGNDGVTVYVAWDILASGMEPDWLRNNFTQTDHFVGVSTGAGQHRLWAREYSEGDAVTLGGASAAGSGAFRAGTNNYFVLFGDARHGLETYYTLSAEGTFDQGIWSIVFSLTDADGHSQSVSATFDETAGGGEFGLFARHPDAAGGVSHPPVWEIGSFSIEFLESLEGFQSWREFHFGGQLDNPEISGPDASPAGDGVKNLIKYALDLSPFVPVSSANLPLADITAEGALIMVYWERTDIDDIEYIPQVSEDLITWQTGAPHVIEFLRQAGDEAHIQEVGVMGQISENAPRGFLRLMIQQKE